MDAGPLSGDNADRYGRGPRSFASSAWDQAAPVLFLAIFLFFWVTLDAFKDNSDPGVLLPSMGGDIANQIVALLLSAGAVLYVLQSDIRRALIVVSPALVALFICFAVTALVSDMPAIALRKIVLAGLIVVQGAALLLIPASRRQFALLLAIGLSISLALSILGLALVPARTIHQASDLVEPNLAGDWRGVFAHKNVLGSASALMVVIGLFVRRAYDARVGWAIVATAAALLLFAGSKTSIGLLPIAFVMAYAMQAVGSAGARILLALFALGGMSLLTVGSAFFPSVRALIEVTGVDVTFTDRVAIWQLSLSMLAERPLTGFGFQTLWGSADMLSSGSSIESWANKATNAHNGYLDIALNAGIPGLVLFLFWFVVQPVRDLSQSIRVGADPVLNTLFLRIWAFALFSGCLESIYFGGGGPVWITVLIAVFGLRLQARARLAHEDDHFHFRPARTS